jgi:hypothetical protein
MARRRPTSSRDRRPAAGRRQADTGGRKPGPMVTRLLLGRHAGLEPVPAVDRVAAAVSRWASASSTTPSRAPSTWPLRVPGLPGLPGFQALAARPRAAAGLGAGAGRRLLRRLPLPLLPRAVDAPGPADDVDLVVAGAGILLLLEATRRALGCRWSSWPSSSWPTPSAALHARPDRAQGRVAEPRHVAPVAHHRRRVRRRAGRVHRLHLPVRAVRRACWTAPAPATTSSRVAFALLGPHARRSGQGGGGASAATGMISGSSIANVVTTGTFTIPLMKRVGYRPDKAGAVESPARSTARSCRR